MFNKIGKIFMKKSSDKKHDLFISTITRILDMQIILIKDKIKSRSQLNTPYCRGYIFGCCEELLILYDLAKDGIGTEELCDILTVYIEIFGDIDGPIICGTATHESEESYLLTTLLVKNEENLTPNRTPDVNSIEEFAKGRVKGSKDIFNYFIDKERKFPFGLYDFFQ